MRGSFPHGGYANIMRRRLGTRLVNFVQIIGEIDATEGDSACPNTAKLHTALFCQIFCVGAVRAAIDPPIMRDIANGAISAKIIGIIRLQCVGNVAPYITHNC